jgi:DNA polymerase type B, organellar and viral
MFASGRKWCHKCVVSYTPTVGCNCDDCEPVHKRPKIRKCLWCNKNNCNGEGCSKNCHLCGVSVVEGRKHRCFVYAPTNEEEAFWRAGDPVDESGKGPYMLWAYDLESAIKRIDDVYDTVFETDGAEFKIQNGKYITSCIERASHDVNMVVFRNVFDTNSETVYFGKDALERFILKMLTCNDGRNIAVAHNGSGYDTRLVFETASKFEKQIKPIARGCKFLQLKVGKSTIFRDSLLHLPGGLAKLAKDFLGPAANMRKGHFPHLFNSEENYGYIGEIPEKKYFDMTFFAKNSSDVTKFNEWYEERKKLPWHFMQELTEYCKNDVAILAQLMQEYHQICVEKFKISPWFSATAPSYVHKVVKAMISTDEFLQLPDKEDKERYKARIAELAEEEHWGVLRSGEYWFARLALRGGRTDARHLYYNLSEEEKAKGYEIRYQDIVSMYPYVQVAHQYPVGLPEICIYDLAVYPCKKHQNPDKGNVINLICDCNVTLKQLDSDKMLNITLEIYEPTVEEILEDETFFGIVCATLEPPKNLFHPVLVVWDSAANKCVASLEKISFGVFTTPEFKKALSVGYKLVKLHRLDKYKYKSGLWNDFIKELYIEKMANSESKPSQEMQDMLVEKYEERFGMGDAVLESFSRWAKNSAKRQVFKIMLNSGWGKHCQRAIMGQVLMVSEEDDESVFALFANLQENIVKVQDMREVGKLTMIRFEALGISNPDLHDSYIPAGVFVPAYGRLQLYEYLEKLGKRVLYHDTDSIVYLYKPEEDNIPSSDVWGSWSEEEISRNANIQTFVSLGPKTYGIKTKSGETMIKAKGLSLKHSHRNILNFEKMEELIHKHLVQKYPKVEIPQFSFVYKPGQGMYTNYFLKKFYFQPETLKGNLHSDLRVYPHGFCKGCMDNPEHCNE